MYRIPKRAHTYTHTHTVRVQLRLAFLCLEGLHFATSRSALQLIPLVCYIVCKSIVSHICSAVFLSWGHFAFAVEIPFQSTGAPSAFIILLFTLPVEADPQTCFLGRGPGMYCLSVSSRPGLTSDLTLC